MPEFDHSPIKVIQKLLIDDEVGMNSSALTGDWKVYTHNVTDEAGSDQAIFIISSPGVLDGREHRTGEVSEHYGFQIITRARGSEQGSFKVMGIQTYFAKNVKRKEVELDDRVYMVHSVTRTSGIIPLGQEEKNRRYKFSANFTATISVQE